MKKVLLMAVILPMLAGCGKEEVENNPAESVDNPKEYTVSLGFSGEITDITESPLNRGKHSVNHVFSSPTSIINFTSKKPSYDDTRRSGRDNELLQRAQNDL